MLAIISIGYTMLLILIFVLIFVSPNDILKSIFKRPTRLKGFCVWLLVLIVSYFLIRSTIPKNLSSLTEEQAERLQKIIELEEAERLQEKETYHPSYNYSKPKPSDTTTKKPFRVFPLR